MGRREKDHGRTDVYIDANTNAVCVFFSPPKETALFQQAIIVPEAEWAIDSEQEFVTLRIPRDRVEFGPMPDEPARDRAVHEDRM